MKSPIASLSFGGFLDFSPSWKARVAILGRGYGRRAEVGRAATTRAPNVGFVETNR